ncbi:hypothetical protein Btru_064665 [Bulinus truncatus]|nr:hypothetical protein Btru_064665 [Bulinus truncatus]
MTYTCVSNRLDPVHAIHIAVVMEDLYDQLEVLGHTVGAPNEPRSRTSIQQHEPQSKHSVWADKSDPIHIAKSRAFDDVSSGYLNKHQYNSRIPRIVFETYFPRTPKRERRLTEIVKGALFRMDNKTTKLQADKAFLQWSVQFVLEDLLKHNSFEALKAVVENEQNKKKFMTDMFTKIVQDTEKMKRLRVDIKKAKKEKILEIQQLDVQISEARDNLLEMNLRKPMEAAYTQKSGKVTISKVRKKCLKEEKEAGDRMREAKWNIANESKCHEAMVRIIKAKTKITKSLFDHWVEKYDRDTTRLQAELDEVKMERARDMSRLAYLRKMIDDYEEIVQDDRRIKKKVTDKVLKNERERKCATRLQAWWRGTMVRRCLGPHKSLFSDMVERRKARLEKKK